MATPEAPSEHARPDVRAVSAQRRIVTVIVAVAVGVHVVAAWLARPMGFMTGQDDAEYVILARSLRSGGYHELHRAGEPIHAQYPPGYPAMIAAWTALVGDEFDRVVLLNLGLSAAMLLVLRRVMLKRRFGEVEATGSVLVLAVNPSLVGLAGSVRSEPAHMLLALGCLLALGAPRPTRRSLVIGGALAIAAALTRSIGAALLAAVAAHWLLERRWKAVAAFAVAAGVTVGAWLVWTALAPGQYVGSSYVADLRAGTAGVTWAPGPLRRIPDNVAWYARTAVPWALAIPTVRGTVLDNAASLLLLILLGSLGLWTLLRRWRPAALYLLLYAGVLALWLWRVERFVVGLLPLIVPAVLMGGTALGALVRLRRPWLVPAAIALVLLATGAVRTADAVADARRCDRTATLPDPACMTADQASFFDAIRWTQARADEDAVFLTAKAAPLWIYTGRQSVSFHAAARADTAALIPFLQELGTDYILLTVLDEAEPRRFAPRLAAVCDRLALEATFPPNALLFSIRTGASSNGDACTALARYLRDNEGREY
jgi:hypothetical protein